MATRFFCKVDGGKDRLFTPYKESCGPCIKQGWQNNKKGRTCFLGFKQERELEDFYRNKHKVKTFEEVYALYELWESQRIERRQRQYGALATPDNPLPEFEPDPFADWLVKRGICPHAFVTTNSRYHFENVLMCDGEMGLTLPEPNLGLTGTPAIFIEALKIVRHEKTKVSLEDGENNRNKGGPRE